jgi:hypothetical protein
VQASVADRTTLPSWTRPSTPLRWPDCSSPPKQKYCALRRAGVRSKRTTFLLIVNLGHLGDRLGVEVRGRIELGEAVRVSRTLRSRKHLERGPGAGGALPVAPRRGSRAGMTASGGEAATLGLARYDQPQTRFVLGRASQPPRRATWIARQARLRDTLHRAPTCLRTDRLRGQFPAHSLSRESEREDGPEEPAPLLQFRRPGTQPRAAAPADRGPRGGVSTGHNRPGQIPQALDGIPVAGVDTATRAT